MTFERQELYILSKLKELNSFEHTAIKENVFIENIKHTLNTNLIITLEQSLQNSGLICVTNFGATGNPPYIYITGEGLKHLHNSKWHIKIKNWIFNLDNIWEILVVILSCDFIIRYIKSIILFFH
ncbi:MAG: hypothetical protein AABY22_30320 [Nanoarchaeota archaeon]|mgnify:CR=1 FL=1